MIFVGPSDMMLTSARQEIEVAIYCSPTQTSVTAGLSCDIRSKTVIKLCNVFLLHDLHFAASLYFLHELQYL